MKTTKHRHGHRWTTEELRELIRLWEADEQPDVKAIAETLGTTDNACLKMIVRLRQDGVPVRRKRRGHVPGRSNRHWTQEEVEYLFRRRLAGATMEDVAHDLDRTLGAVQSMIQNLRKAGVPVAMMGCGVRRQWSPEDLKAAAVARFDPKLIALAEDVAPS